MPGLFWSKDDLDASKADSATQTITSLLDDFRARWEPKPQPTAAPEPIRSAANPSLGSFSFDLKSLTPWASDDANGREGTSNDVKVPEGTQRSANSSGSLFDLDALTPWARPKEPEPSRADTTPLVAGIADARPVAPSGVPAEPDTSTWRGGGSPAPARPQPAPSADAGPINNSSRQAFVRSAWPYMLQAAGGNTDAAEMMLAAAISENGDVGKGGGFIGNNFFGIKGKGDAGSFNAATWEQTPSGPTNIRDDFAAYSSPVAGFRAFFDFLQNNSRYAQALANYQRTGDASQLFRDVNAAGYATDPSWASKVENIRANQVAPVTRALAAGAPQPAAPPPGPPAGSSASPPAPAAGSGAPEYSPDTGTAAPAFQAPTGRAGGGGVMQMFRQPTDPEASTGAEYDPRDADQGPRETGYATPAATYGDAGDEPQVPAYQPPAPQYGPPLSEAGPEQPSYLNPAAEPTPYPERPALSEQFPEQPNILERATAPAREVYGRAIEDVNQQEDEVQRRNEEVITSELGRTLIAPVETIRRGVRLATAIVQATPEATTAEVDAALQQYGYGKDQLGADLPIVGRVGIADAVLALAPNRTIQAAMTAGMPIAHAPGMGAEFGQGVAGAIERGTGRVVQAGINAGREALEQGAEAVGRAGRALGEEGARQLMDLTPMPRIVPRTEARRIPGDVRMPTDPAFQEAVSRTPGAFLDDADGLDVDVVRFQKPTQAGQPVIRGGVFYAPTGEGANYERPLWSPVGGPQRVEGSTIFNRPLPVAQGSFGPMVRAFDDLTGQPGGYKRIAQEIDDALGVVPGDYDAQGVLHDTLGTPAGAARLREAVRSTLEAHGAPPETADVIVDAVIRQHREGMDRRFAVQNATAETILAERARAAGYDSIVTYDPGGAIREILDLRESHYPTPEGGYTLHPEFQPQEQPGLISRARSALAANAERVAAADARMAAEGSTGTYGTLGVVPPDEPVRIPRAGYATDLSEGAEDLVRRASEANAPRETVHRADVAQKAQDILGVDPEAAQRWQSEALGEAPASRAVRGEALRQAEYIDAENANRAIERLRDAQRRASEAGGVENLTPDDRFDVADALLEAAETARAFERSAAASTAEGRATARALGQRRSAITARQAFESAQRARQVGQDAAFAAREVQRAAVNGQVTEEGVRRLRIVRDKLLEAEKNGLVGDGAGGRLDAREQQAAVARATMGVNPRPGVGLGTRIASEVGSSLSGGVMGAAGGAALPAETPEERRRNALIGAGVGLVGAPLARRLLGRGRGEALGLLGAAPTPEIPNRSVAIGADPARRYEFRYRVANLDDLIPSNLSNGAPNPAFPRELQPRSRERVASQLQIGQIARGLEPDALLTDVGRLDAGPMIVGPDRIVESGNGRTLGLQRAADQYPEQYQRYVDTLRSNLGEYGLTERDLQGVTRPVLVRERVTPVDRAAFAQEANNAGLLRMSSFEQAVQDAGNLSDDAVTALQVGENDTIQSALRKTENRDLVRRWVGTLPENERGGVIDAAGDLSAQGYERLTNALLVRTYGQGAGERLARTFIESADPTVRNVQTALMQSLPDVARAEALVRTGQRDAGLSIADDVAAATEMLARLRRDGIRPDEYLAQSAMFERELTPLQESILEFLSKSQRRPSSIREALRDYAARVENTADPNQVDMFGGQMAAPSREDLWRGATAGSGVDVPEPTPLEARAAVERAPTNGAGLARPEPEPVAPARSAAPAVPEPPAERPARPEPVAPERPAPVAQERPGPVPEGVAPRGGPEGTLAQEGAPTRLAPPTAAERGTLPAGGPEGRLAVEGAPETPPARPGAVSEGFAPTGGPEGRLTREGAPPEPANLPAAGDFSTGGPESTLTLQSGRTIKDVAAQIDDVLANPTRPGAADRLQQLHQDLQEISAQGFARSSQIRERLQRNGLLRAGLASKDQNVDALVQALANVDPNKPEQMRAVLSIISKPRLLDRLLEYQYVNMLSSPITQAVNVASNSAQIAGRLLLQNPLEFAYSGGRSTGPEAAFKGAARGLKEGLGEAGQIMRTGTSTEDVERGLALGDYSHINRETLPALFHVISTRPLAAMDALLGRVAYASAAEQLAQRKADQLLRSGSQAVKGMDREAARAHVMANIWDYPDIIERAGKIEDYTLLRGRGDNVVENGLRMLASARNAPEGAGFERQALAFAANNILPFFNVPLNFAKQGIERTAGVPVNTIRAARAYGQGDVERGAELLSKATIGAGAVTTAAVLAAGDNLTGDGPSDPGQRAVWLQTHRPNSFRAPGTQTWYSWESTPWAIPFGMMAGVKEGWSEARERSAKKGQADALDQYGSAALKAGQGAFQGLASQSFIRSLGDQYKLMTGQETGLSTVANQLAGTASRFMPASGMVNFLAGVTDSMERDVGKPQAVSDLPENVGARVAGRIPGLRQQVSPRLDIYGQPTPNEQYGAAGLLPYYRGEGPRAGDPITQRLEEAGIGAPQASFTFPGEVIGLPKREAMLTVPEQRRYQELYGQAFRARLEATRAGEGGLTPAQLTTLRSQAQDIAQRQLAADIGPGVLRQRIIGQMGQRAS